MSFFDDAEDETMLRLIRVLYECAAASLGAELAAIDIRRKDDDDVRRNDESRGGFE